MSVIIKKNTFYLFVAIVFISCNSYYNTKKINTISKLQYKTDSDLNLLNSIPTSDLNNKLKIAKLNLAKIEKKKLDSIALELIYFEYKAYINCVNTVYEGMQEIKVLNQELHINHEQLKNIKYDYENSRAKRDDLIQHLTIEDKIVKATSSKVLQLVEKMETQILKFDTINSEIESLIHL